MQPRWSDWGQLNGSVTPSQQAQVSDCSADIPREAEKCDLGEVLAGQMRGLGAVCLAALRISRGQKGLWHLGVSVWSWRKLPEGAGDSSSLLLPRAGTAGAGSL